MTKYTELASINRLIKAVDEYQIELEKNRHILTNAANICDAAMGSDDISQTYIKRLDEALAHLAKTSALTQATAEALRENRNDIIRIIESTK